MTLELTITLPLRLVNPTNERSHWTVRAKRAAQERSLVRMSLAALKAWPPNLPAQVSIVRLAPRAMDDDGAIAASKSVRDGVADALGVDDGSSLVRFVYGQRRASKGQAGTVRGYGCEIVVREVT